ncbi:hypothetical protein B1R27_13270 [Streptomyces sp. GKU 895]|nr:hypothetical protein B1R27_13270 [Streptomyces sp. GKU 895]
MGDHLAAAIRRFRLRAGLTQEALAERSGVSVSTIRGMESGRRRNPQLASVRQLAAALELRSVELDKLLAAAAGAAEPSTVPVPRQLPAPPAPFVGRLEELDLLDAAMRGRFGRGTHRGRRRDRAPAEWASRGWRCIGRTATPTATPMGSSSSTYVASAPTVIRWIRPWRYADSSTRWVSSPTASPSLRTRRRRCSAAWWRTSRCCWCSTTLSTPPRSPRCCRAVTAASWRSPAATGCRA